MKGVKDDNIMMVNSPLFPRIHVKDTQTGGPRAPPRNKMALYEHLCVPPQKSNSGSASSFLLPPINAATSSRKELGLGPREFSPIYIPRLSSSHALVKESCYRSLDAMNLNTKMGEFQGSSVKNENYKICNGVEQLSSTKECNCAEEPGIEDDGRGPTLVKSDTNLCSSKCQLNIDGERWGPISPKQPNVSTKVAGNNMLPTAKTTGRSLMGKSLEKDLKHTNTRVLASMQHPRNQSKEVLEESSKSKRRKQSPRSQASTRGKTSEQLEQSNASPNQGHQPSPLDGSGTISYTDALLHRDPRSGLSCEETTCSGDIVGDSMEVDGRENVSRIGKESCNGTSLENCHRILNEAIDDSEFYGGNEYCSLQMRDVERNDNVSETSVVECVSGLNISPDDVVGLIGQKHFWRTRRLIVTQQRTFASQVFELHRLITVQKLIARSPHLLLEYDSCVYNDSPKESLVERLPPDNVIESPQQIVKQKVDSQTPDQSSDCAVDNGVQKAPVPFDNVNKGTSSEHPNHAACPGIPPAALMPGSNADPWLFQPPSGNQWLVPVMSPSEGLVYKPYAPPFPSNAGFMAPIYGGSRLMGVPPLPGHFMNPDYGAHASQPIAPPIAQTYLSHMHLPPYDMPMMNPINSPLALEMNPSARDEPHHQATQSSTEEHDNNMHSQNPYYMLMKMSGITISCTEDGELQENTASNSDNLGVDASQASKGNNVPGDPTVGNSNRPLRCSSNQKAQVIKVVPRNPRSATESATKIFQSIKEERQQYDPL